MVIPLLLPSKWAWISSKVKLAFVSCKKLGGYEHPHSQRVMQCLSLSNVDMWAESLKVYSIPQYLSHHSKLGCTMSIGSIHWRLQYLEDWLCLPRESWHFWFSHNWLKSIASLVPPQCTCKMLQRYWEIDQICKQNQQAPSLGMYLWKHKDPVINLT